MLNCEIGLDLSWSKRYIISEISKPPGVATNPTSIPPTKHILQPETTRVTFQINSTKLFVSVVTLSINNNLFSKNIK